MADRIRSFAWKDTTLGPIESWHPSLPSTVDMVLSCGFPATLQWGRELTLFYNDAYIPLIGSLHPIDLGRPLLETFPEITATYQPIIERIWRGERIVLENQLYRYTRHNDPENLYFDLSYSPVFAPDGSVGGVHAIGLNTTKRVYAERAKAETDARLKRVLETDAVGVIFFDFSGTVVDANDVFLRITGYSREEIAARKLDWRVMTPPEWVKASEEQMANLSSTGRIGPYEKEYILKDGSRRWMLFAGRDLGDGTIAEYCIDITPHRTAVTALRTSEARFRALVESTSDVVYRMNPEWTEMQELGGRRFRESIETPETRWIHKYIHPEDQPRVRAAIQEAIEKGSNFQLEHRVLRDDGSQGWTFSRATPLRNDAGQITEWFGAASDITLRKHTEEALIETEKLATLGRLAASISHEINNPLEAITNLLFLVKISEGLSAEAKANIDLAEAELRRIAHITRQSLGFYRETASPAMTSITELMDSSIDLLKGKVAAKGAQIDRDWNSNLTVVVVPGELRQVLSNLLANSLDALENGGRIRIRARGCTAAFSNRRAGVCITIADDGKGIPAEARPRIFDPFFSTKGKLGTGLGLWVSQQIIEKNGGRIRMRSRCDGSVKGTVFLVYLPHSKG